MVEQQLASGKILGNNRVSFSFLERIVRLMEQDKNPMPQFDLFPKLTAVGRFLCRVASYPYQLASHSDHLFEHPLDSPIEPVTDWPDHG